jgi:hypothetical protein
VTYQRVGVTYQRVGWWRTSVSGMTYQRVGWWRTSVLGDVLATNVTRLISYEPVA